MSGSTEVQAAVYPPGTKLCSKCRLPRSLENDYYLDRRRPGRRSARCKACVLAQVKAHQRSLRDRVLEHYGGRECACCSATSDLSIDHVRGDGDRHRAGLLESKSSNPGALTDYVCRWIIRNDFPAGFQVLCSRCGSSKSAGTTCKLHGKYLGAEQDQVALTA